jgi:hypothetical protein
MATSIDCFDLNAAAAAWVAVEVARFDLRPLERQVIRMVTDLTVSRGLSDVRVKQGFQPLEAWAGGTQLNHIGTTIRDLADAKRDAPLRRVLLPLSPISGMVRLGLNLNFWQWGVRSLRTTEAQWRMHQAALNDMGLPVWLLPPEKDLNDALVEVSFETFIERFKDALNFRNHDEPNPNSGAAVRFECATPKFGVEIKRGFVRAEDVNQSMESSVSCANANLKETQRPRARARVDKLLIDNCKSLSMTMSREELKLAISDGDEREFCQAARQIMGAKDWDDGRLNGRKGEGAQWRMRYRHHSCKNVTIAVFLEMIESAMTGGGMVKKLWLEWGGRDLDVIRLKNQKGIFLSNTESR